MCLSESTLVLMDMVSSCLPFHADECHYTGIVFDNLNGNNIQYTIRPVHEVFGEDDESTWNTDDTQPRFQVPGPRVSPKYIKYKLDRSSFLVCNVVFIWEKDFYIYKILSVCRL